MKKFKVTAVGPASSGTRLLARILNASPDIEGCHDATHGVNPVDTEHVVVITRDPQPTDASFKARFGEAVKGGIPSRQGSEVLFSCRYPNAFQVSYEDLVADSSVVIDSIAEHFNIKSWPCPEVIYDGNAKWMIRSTL